MSLRSRTTNSSGYCLADWKTATRRGTLDAAKSIGFLAIVLSLVVCLDANGQETEINATLLTGCHLAS